MLRKTLVALLAVALFGAAFAAPAQAQSQAVSFNVGYFAVRGLDGRAATDIAANELVLGGNIDLLDYRLQNFNNATFGAEWLIGLGGFLEGGVGIAYYSSGSVPSVSLNFVNTNGSEITQALRLRNIPITATVRFLPLGRRSVVEPYIGGGLGIFIWRYSEVGQFVDSNQNIFSSTFVASGTKVGPVLLGGVRIPVGKYAIGGEIRYQKAEGDLSSVFAPLATTVDLGGLTYQATFVVRFGGK
jgi:opacity protein-like surface antigen